MQPEGGGHAATAVAGLHGVGGVGPYLRGRARNRACGGVERHASWQGGRRDAPIGDCPRSGDRGRHRRQGPVQPNPLTREGVSHARGHLVHHAERETDVRGAARVVGPYRVGNGGGLQNGGRPPHRAVGCSERQPSRQRRLDGPGDHGTVSAHGRGHREGPCVGGVDGQHHGVCWVGDSWEVIHHGEVEVGHARAAAVVGPHRVGHLGPQLGRCTVKGAVVGTKGDTVGQGAVDGPRSDHPARVGLVIDGRWTVRVQFTSSVPVVDIKVQRIPNEVSHAQSGVTVRRSVVKVMDLP